MVRLQRRGLFPVNDMAPHAGLGPAVPVRRGVRYRHHHLPHHRSRLVLLADARLRPCTAIFCRSRRGHHRQVLQPAGLQPSMVGEQDCHGDPGGVHLRCHQPGPPWLLAEGAGCGCVRSCRGIRRQNLRQRRDRSPRDWQLGLLQLVNPVCALPQVIRRTLCNSCSALRLGCPNLSSCR
eukprot:UN1644